MVSVTGEAPRTSPFQSTMPPGGLVSMKISIGVGDGYGRGVGVIGSGLVLHAARMIRVIPAAKMAVRRRINYIFSLNINIHAKMIENIGIKIIKGASQTGPDTMTLAIAVKVIFFHKQLEN